MENGNFNNLQEGGKYYDKINTNNVLRQLYFRAVELLFHQFMNFFVPQPSNMFSEASLK